MNARLLIGALLFFVLMGVLLYTFLMPLNTEPEYDGDYDEDEQSKRIKKLEKKKKKLKKKIDRKNDKIDRKNDKIDELEDSQFTTYYYYS